MAFREEFPIPGRETKLDADQAKLLRDSLAQLPKLTPEFIREMERLIGHGEGPGLTAEELAELEGRSLFISHELERRKSEDFQESRDERPENPRKGWWQKASGYKSPEYGLQPDVQHRDIEKIREDLKKQEGSGKTKSARVRDAYSRDRFKESRNTPQPDDFQEKREVPGWHERERGLASIEIESKKPNDRLSKERAKRIDRMRSKSPRRGEKRNEKNELHSQEARDDLSERVHRINILLRAGVYDSKRLEKLPEIVSVEMLRQSAAGVNESHSIEVPKKDIEEWLAALTPYERQRLYVLGRKKIDFKLDRNDEEFKDKTDDEFEREKVFQKEQKQLADALEIVAIPMLRGVFKSLGKNVEVYLTSANDDIAGGLDVAIELKKRDGSPHRFHENGMPMRFVVDMTYARMKNKLEKDRNRGRVCDEAFNILKGPNKMVPTALSNARAMKLFRTLVEILGGNMSTLTFDKKGPLAKRQEHIPRLILGLDWESAFSEIANWVEEGDAFEEKFKESDLARRITQSIENQLKGLHAIATRDPNNPNTEYLAQILRTMDFSIDKQRGIADDKSLENIDRLLASDAEALGPSLRKRLYEAALAQVAHDKARGGGHVRGDMPVPARSKAQSQNAESKGTELTVGGMSDPATVPTADDISASARVSGVSSDVLRQMEEKLEILKERERILELERRLRDLESKK